MRYLSDWLVAIPVIILFLCVVLVLRRHRCKQCLRVGKVIHTTAPVVGQFETTRIVERQCKVHGRYSIVEYYDETEKEWHQTGS